MANHQQQKTIDIDKVVHYLNNAFIRAVARSTHVPSRNHAGTELHRLQVEFCYMIDNIQRGPKYMVPKLITKANELIDSLS